MTVNNRFLEKLHPNGHIYQWVTSRTLEDTEPGDLPLITADFLKNEIEPILAKEGWEPEAAKPECNGEAFNYDGYAGGYWSEINARAMENLDAWVPDLDLPKLKRTSPGAYTAVASWRNSGTGIPSM